MRGVEVKAVASHAEIIGVGGFENQEAAGDEYAQGLSMS